MEEQLAEALRANEAEGCIARRGAVRAALKAEDYARAQSLVERYAHEAHVPKALRTELRKMLKADAAELSEQFPSAAKHHRPSDVQMLASKLQQNGPFWLAA